MENITQTALIVLLPSESLQARPPLSAFSVLSFQASTEHVPLKPSWSGPPQKH